MSKSIQVLATKLASISTGIILAPLSAQAQSPDIQSITSIAARTPPSVTLAAAPTSVNVGDSSTLTWSSSHAYKCSASGEWSGKQTTSGNLAVTIATAGEHIYTLACTGLGGTTSASITITGLAPLPKATAYQITPDHAGAIEYATELSFPSAPSWSTTLGGPASYPIIADGLVFVTTASTSGYGTYLYALDEASGVIVWGPTFLSGTYFWSNATYENGTLFVVNTNGLLRSFDAATGTPGWSVSLPGQYFFSAPPSAKNGIVYVGGAGSGGTVYAVDESNGAVLWKTSVANGDISSPAVTDTGVYVSYPCQVYDLNPSTGAQLWKYSGGCSGGGGRTVAAKNNEVFVRDPATADSGIIYDAATGAQLSTFKARPIPAISDNTAVYLDYGTLSGVDLASGVVLWSFAGDGYLVSAPILANNTVFVGSSTGTVFAVDAATGAQQWNGFAGARINAPDEQNVSQPLTGIASGEGVLIVPAGSKLTAWKIIP